MFAGKTLIKSAKLIKEHFRWIPANMIDQMGNFFNLTIMLLPTKNTYNI